MTSPLSSFSFSILIIYPQVLHCPVQQTKTFDRNLLCFNCCGRPWNFEIPQSTHHLLRAGQEQVFYLFNSSLFVKMDVKTIRYYCIGVKAQPRLNILPGMAALPILPPVITATEMKIRIWGKPFSTTKNNTRFSKNCILFCNSSQTYKNPSLFIC